jgi:hypothetical protein
MTLPRPSENDLWIMNYYRSGEIKGALFFGRIARIVRGPLQVDVTHHFADEATHAHYWTECLNDLGYSPSRETRGYQDQYLDAVGLPANLMEVMAITLVFEKRVIRLYNQHLRSAPHPRVRQTIETIMHDERWHVKYVREALQEMGAKYGDEVIDATLARYTAADDEIYAKTLAEHGERMQFLTEASPGDHWPSMPMTGPPDNR